MRGEGGESAVGLRTPRALVCSALAARAHAVFGQGMCHVTPRERAAYVSDDVYCFMVGTKQKRDRNDVVQGRALGPEKQWACASRRTTEVNPSEAGMDGKTADVLAAEAR